jgi:hypothetical protein
MAWSKNGTPETLSGVADVVQITDLTAYKFNQFMCHNLTDTGDLITMACTFNNNTNSVYAHRKSENGGTDNTSTSIAYDPWWFNATNTDYFSISYWVSISGEEKLGITFSVERGTATGAGTAPERVETVGKFVPSPDADITRIDITQLVAGGDYDTGSNLSALGTN